MTRLGMGFGKDQHKVRQGVEWKTQQGPPTHRPCVTVHSSRCQLVLNRWFGTKDQKKHPDWMTSEFQSPPRVRAADKGEWQLVWHPKSRPNTVTVPARKVLRTLRDDDEKMVLKARLAHELSDTNFKTTGDEADAASPVSRSRSQRDDAVQPLPRDQLASQASNRSRLPTRGSQRAVSTAGSILKSERGRPGSSVSDTHRDLAGAEERLGTAFSRVSRATKASHRSRSSLGTSSTLTRNSEELLSRIKGLEEALLQEKGLRERMQSMLALESFAEGS
jgi:hypothetical protein